MKKLLTITFLCVFAIALLTSATTFANDEIRVYLDGERIEFDTPPQIVNGRTMVPMRAIFEAFGAWFEWRSETRTIETGNGGWTYTLQIGNYQIAYFHPLGGVEDGIGPTVIVEGYIQLDAAPFIADGRTLVPLAAISEILGATAEWDGVTRTVTITSQNAAQEPASQAIAANFETALFGAMPRDENYMFSPFSLRMALAMAANGATGETQTELLNVLGISDLNAFNRAAAEFIASANSNEDVEFNIANSIWFNEDLFGCNELDFRDTFKQIIADYFAGTAERISAQDGADIINAWISQQTMDRINDIVAEDTFDEDSETLMVLVNALYFMGAWAVPFSPDMTRDDIFTNRDGIESPIPFMEHTSWFAHYENEYFQMLAKPYADENIRMYFVLPHGAERLSFDMFTNAIGEMSHTYVRFRLPRFTTEFMHGNLAEILQDMGIRRAFERESHFDFWDMIYPTSVFGQPLYVWIEDVLQKTFIDLDEAGTEAAAATVIYMDAMPVFAPPPAIPFYCNRPFIYFIRNDATGDVLFIGEFAFAG